MLRHIAKAVLVILFVLLARLVLYIETDRSFDNSLAAVLAGRPQIPAGAIRRAYGHLPDGSHIDVWASVRHLFGSQWLAEFIGVGTGIAVWVFVAAILYLWVCRHGDNETRCRRCRAVLQNLCEPKCERCGEAV